MREAAWLIERYIAILERRPIGADIHVSAARLARVGEAIAGLKAIAAAFDAEAEDDPTAHERTEAEEADDGETDTFSASSVAPDDPEGAR